MLTTLHRTDLRMKVEKMRENIHGLILLIDPKIQEIKVLFNENGSLLKVF